VAALAEKRYLSDQEPAMVASMDFVAAQTVLLNRRMLECERSPLFSVAFITKIVHGISLNHSFYIRCAHRIMAVRTFYLALP
jgi:hypothetical protein